MSLLRKNRAALLLAALMLALSALIVSLPVYHFNATVMTKRSGNTCVGDERYKAARTEAEAVSADYAARGIHTEITEEITERVNSKGETTSLIVFRVNKEVLRTGWDFLQTGFPSGIVLAAQLGCGILALILALLGSAGCMGASRRDLPPGRRRLRRAAVALSLAVEM